MRNGISPWWWLHPGAVWFTVLATVFATEYAVMMALPWLLPGKTGYLLEAAVDAFTLTLVLAPVLWWTVVRPLREVIRLRTRYFTDLFSRIEDNKRQLAYELHDGIGQSLSLLVSGLRSAQESMTGVDDGCRCARLVDLAQSALKDVKRLALGMRPSLLDDLGLEPALERLVDDMREQYPIAFQLDVAEVAGSRLPEAVETAVFRIVQEALTNVVTHARARSATVLIQRQSGVVRVEVADDGCGFGKAQQENGTPGHLGLIGMRERAALQDGQLVIESTPGQGTRIKATIPVGA